MLKADNIVTVLRHQIVRGEFRPDSRFPTQRELAERFRTTPVTMQRVFDRLASDGFIRTKEGVGTYLVPNPPHLCDYGLVFISRQGAKDWRRFDTALLNEASTVNGEHARKMHFYHDIAGHTDSHAQRDRLLADMRAHKLAGVIFTTDPPTEMMHMVPWQSLPVPVVAIRSQPDIPGVPVVTPHDESFMARALDYLASRGRRRVAFLNRSQLNQVRLEKWQHVLRTLASERGMTFEPYWMLAVGMEGTRNMIQLLFEPGRPNRPDALFITDDNLVEHATAGLVAAGVRVPEDVDVVAHCNFPWPVPSAVPIKRLGYDAREVLRQCMSVIDMQRQGQTPPKQVFVEAVFEEEVAAASEQHVAS